MKFPEGTTTIKEIKFHQYRLKPIVSSLSRGNVSSKNFNVRKERKYRLPNGAHQKNI